MNQEVEGLVAQKKKVEEELAFLHREKLELEEIAAMKREVNERKARLEEGEMKMLADREQFDEEKEAFFKEHTKMRHLQAFSGSKVPINVTLAGAARCRLGEPLLLLRSRSS